MSRKHNVKHIRSRSNYPERLAARGISSRSVRMIDFIKVQAHPDTLPGKTPTAAQLEKVAAIKAMNGGLLS